MNQKILSILVCPQCRSSLVYDRQNARLLCKIDKLIYPINNDILKIIPEKTTSKD